MPESLPVIITILCTAVGATWVVSSYLATMSSSIASLVARVNQHEADIIDLKKHRNSPSRRRT